MRRAALGRMRALAMVGVLAAGSMIVTIATAPQAAAAVGPVLQAGTNMVSADALPTVQIDGVVWQQAIAGNTVYAGGSFGNARPAGATPGTNQVARANLLAYDINTGSLISSFAPTLNGQVRAVSTSPDGSRVYVGGDFTTINGITKSRIAAFSTDNGQLITAFDANVNFTVRAIVATDTAVYVGGAFNSSRGVARNRLAAFSASTGALLGWNPNADATVNAMVMAPDGSKIIAGGSFANVNGAPAYGMAAIDPTTAALLPWAATNSIRDAGTNSAILSLTTDGTAIYGSGYRFGTGGNLEGSFKASPSNGAIQWIEDCHGDTYDTAASGGVVYTVSHAHFCGNIGGFWQSDPWSTNMRHAVAFTDTATGTIEHDKLGYFDWFGFSSPSLYNWFPDLATGTFTGQTQAAWDVTANSDYVVLGGEFPTVNGVGQQGLVRFKKRSLSPSGQGPRLSGASFAPRLLSLNAGSVRVSWPANWDRDDMSLTYNVIRDNDTAHPVFTSTGTSTFWNRSSLGFVDSGLTPGSTHAYRIQAVDPDGNSVLGNNVSITATAGALGAYTQRVLGDNAGQYWRLAEPSGSVALDSAGFTDSTIASVTRGSAGAIFGDTNAATTFAGTAGSTMSTPTPVPGPNTFSLEAWFNTTTTSGGKIIGFGNQVLTDSTSYDRQIYMDNAGHLIFGVNNGSARTINSTATFNNGQWHHAVATLGSGGIALYVDGVRVANRADVVSAQAFMGYWRVGGDNLNGWASKPTSNYFAGTIDEVAVYPSALSAQAVAQHYQLGTTAAPNQNPVAAFTPTVTNLALAVDGTGSTDPDGSLASYSWNWGDGSPAGTGARASHAYGSAGTFTVTLTVTDDKGATGSASQGITTVAVPPNQNPVAEFTPKVTNLGVSVDAAASSDPDGSISSYSWNWGDGSAAATGVTASHTYGSAGTFPVTLTVTDNRGGTAVVSHDVDTTQPPNQVPVASFTAQSTARALTVNASASSDPDGSIASYAWSWGDGSPDGSGVSASHTFTADGTFTVTLTVTDNVGSIASTSRDLTVIPAVAADAFGRTVTNGWSAAEIGGPWTVSSASKFSVTGQTGQILLSTAGSGPSAALNALSVRDVDGVLDFAVDKPATGGGVYTTVTARKVGTSNYNFTLKFIAGGAVTVAIAKSDNGTATSLGSATVAGLTYAVGDVERLRFQALGTGTTALAVKAWKVGSAEPAAFQVTRSDSTASVQGPGSLSIQAYLSSGSTNAPVAASFDNFSVTGN